MNGGTTTDPMLRPFTASSTSPPGRRCCRSRSSKRCSATSSRCPASACRSSRSAIARRPSRRFSPRPRPTSGALAGVPAELSRAVPPGRRQPAVLDGADESPGAWRRPPTTSTADRGPTRRSRKRRRSATVNVAATTKGEGYSRFPAQSELQLTPRRGVRAHDVEQHDRGHRVQDAPRCRRRPARQRHLVGHVQPPDRRRAGTRSFTPARRRTWARPA